MKVYIDADAVLSGYEQINQRAFHGTDRNLRHKTELLTFGDDGVKNTEFFVERDQLLFLEIHE